jgi:hypothetical protein
VSRPPLTAERALYARASRASRAVMELRKVADELSAVGCRKAAAAVRRALKSVEGAERNAHRFWLGRL